MLEIKPIFNSLLRSKAGAVMLLVQIAITVAIVSNAAFIISDRIAYLHQDTGYPEHEIFSFSVVTFGDDVDRVQKIQENVRMLRNVPGVINAVSLTEIPLSGSGSASSFSLSSEPDNSGQNGVRAAYVMGDEHSLDTLGVEIAQGRNFTAQDVIVFDSEGPMVNVMIASKPFVDEIFPSGDGLGKTVYFGNNPIKIIGIVDKMMGPWLKDRAAEHFVIMPLVRDSRFQKVLVRAHPAQRSVIMARVEQLMLDNYDKRVITNIRALDKAKADYNAEDILMMRMLIVIIVVLVLVTALGIFGLTVFNINKRTKQIGTRRALGARKSDIIRYFLVENCIICLVGISIGAIAAVYLGQLLLLHYELPALDNSFIAVTIVLVLCMSLLSVLMPAYKAANISPSIATRSV